MKALSIRGPWWWFIFNLPPGQHKDVENRDWSYLCRERGNVLVHASKGMSKREFDDACEFAAGIGVTMFPRYDTLRRGGIVGVVEITGHVRQHDSPWFVGPTALVLRNPYPLPFTPCPGALGFFNPLAVPNLPPSTHDDP